MYNDFINEVVAKQTESGKTPRPNVNNNITTNRKRLRNKIEATAVELDKDPADVALEYVNQNFGTLQRYVTVNGEKPLENPVELATQAYILRQRDIEQVQRIIGCNREDAEIYLDESEAKGLELNDPDADNFLGEIFEAVGRVAGKGIQKIADKRAEQGKKPGVFGFLAKLTAPPPVSQMEQAQGNGLQNVGILAKDVLESIKAAEKKKEINKLLPFIIIGVIVLILTVVLITRSTRK